MKEKTVERERARREVGRVRKTKVEIQGCRGRGREKKKESSRRRR